MKKLSQWFQNDILLNISNQTEHLRNLVVLVLYKREQSFLFNLWEQIIGGGFLSFKTISGSLSRNLHSWL